MTATAVTDMLVWAVYIIAGLLWGHLKAWHIKPKAAGSAPRAEFIGGN